MEAAALLRRPTAAAAAAAAAVAATARGPEADAMDIQDRGDGLPMLDLDAIPSLSLPPPIIPTRTMGHSYLENRVHLQLKLGIAGVVPPIRLVCVSRQRGRPGNDV